ncbi:hypothetical protein Tco_0308087 [Tanacetum coccineum]
MKATMAWKCHACDDLVKDYLCVPLDEDEDLEEEEFKEEVEPQEEEEEEEDMDIEYEEDENEPELTSPYEEEDPLNPLPPASDSIPEDVIKVEDTAEPDDKTVPASVHEVGNEVRSSMEEGAAAMENLVRKLGNAEEGAECKKLKKELEDARVFVFEERPNEVIDVPVEDEKSPSSEPRGSPQSVDAAIAVERARQANAGNNASAFGQAWGQVTAPVV